MMTAGFATYAEAARLLAYAACITLLALTACAKKTNEWDNLDYSRIARERYDNDYNYKPPTIAGCAYDDQYNCNGHDQR